MESSFTNLKCVRVEIPYHFVRNSIVRLESEEKFTEDVLKCPFNDEEVHVTVNKNDYYLSLSFDKFFLKFGEAESKFILNTVGRNASDKHLPGEILCTKLQSTDVKNTGTGFEELQKHLMDENLLDARNETDKRKRGRPRKMMVKILPRERIKKVKPLSNSANKVDASEKQDILGDSAHYKSYDQKAHSDCVLDGKRYSLRGKKLNAKIMELEKRDANFIENGSDDENLMIDESTEGKTDLHKNTACNRNQSYTDNIQKQVNAILYGHNAQQVREKHEFACKICCEKFSDLKMMECHLFKIHSNSEDLEKSVKELRELKHSSHFCGDALSEASVLKEPIDSKHEDKDQTFSCSKCEYKSRILGSLKVHIRDMHVEPGIKRAFCHLCSASFRSHGSLKQHIDLNHHGNKYVACEICKKQFYNKSQLRRHQRSHGVDAGKKVFCSVCKKGFLFEFNLKRHMKAIHGPQSECFHCSYCGKGYSQKTAMISHVQLIHFNLLPYSCKECKENFPRANLLKEHMATVHLQPDFEFSALPRNSVYDRTDEDKFFCSYCSEGFLHKVRLIEHMHTDHADAFPYKCDKCRQGFLERSFLTTHTLKAHGTLLDEESLASYPGSGGEILQIITTKSGAPSRVAQNLVCEEVEDESGSCQGDAEYPSAEHMEVTNIHVPEQSAVLLEVAQGEGTTQYVIDTSDLKGEHPESLMQNIANLLVAAEPKVGTTQEISFVLSNQDSSEPVDSSYVDTQEHAMEKEPTCSQTEENMILEASNQAKSCGGVVDQSQQVISTENQAELLHFGLGDVIEMNDSDSANGKSYYRIINVIENTDQVEQQVDTSN